MINSAGAVTDIIKAIKSGNIAELQAALDVRDLDIDRAYEEGALFANKGTALHTAVLFDNAEMVQLLLDRGASIDVRDGSGLTPLRKAIACGNIECIGILLDAEDKKSDEAAKDKPNLLHHALSTGMISVRHYPLFATVITVMTDEERRIKVVKFLLDRGIRDTDVNPDGQSPLHLAASSKDPEIIKLLLEKGTGDINVRTRMFQETPLHFAVKGGNLKVVEELVRHGAGKEIVDDFGRMPIHLAAGSIKISGSLCLRKALPDITSGAIARCVVPHGCDHRDYEGRTPLQRAILADNVPAMEAIIFAGASYDLRDSAGITPLQFAVTQPNPLALERLIHWGASLHEAGLEALLELSRKQYRENEVILGSEETSRVVAAVAAGIYEEAPEVTYKGGESIRPFLDTRAMAANKLSKYIKIIELLNKHLLQ